MAIYTSEITQFLTQLKKDRPQLEASQFAGRALLWDKEPIDLERTRELKDSNVVQKAYPYQTK